MVQAPLLRWDHAPLLDQASSKMSQDRVAWHGILHVEECLGEAPEVVDGLWTLLNAYARGALGEPVRGDAEDGSGCRQSSAPRKHPEGELVVANGVHRAAMPNENCGHASNGFAALLRRRMGEARERCKGGRRAMRRRLEQKAAAA